MITEINRIKHNPIFKKEKAFFQEHKAVFTKKLFQYFAKTNLCPCCVLDKENISNNFYEAIFNPDEDCYNRHICWLENASTQTVIFICSLMNSMIKEFIKYKNTNNYKQSIELIIVLELFRDNFFTALSEHDYLTFDVSPYMPKDNAITYLHNMYKLGRDMRFIIHTKLGTSTTKATVQQIGQHSAVIRVSNEQITMIAEHCNSFIIKENPDEKNFSVKAKVLCAKNNTITISNIKELETYPLLSRKFPRAAIVHASLVHIANENEYITGNMLDISEGGMGIMSSTKCHFEKGQDIVAFVSYEDPKSGFKFSFESNGIITSIIGKENVFRYGIQLDLNDEEKEIIHNLVDILNGDDASN